MQSLDSNGAVLVPVLFFLMHVVDIVRMRSFECVEGIQNSIANERMQVLDGEM